ncbi:MAG TPA: hypothetical protein VNB29_01545 [Chthoniobacterales bacterium]|jgi:hypothetical protein|nr:hypothetical protein [Chthoniobacterales bacterium]
MKVVRSALLGILVLVSLSLFQGCETMQSEDSARSASMSEAIRAEPPGDYFIGRRFYKQDYKFWGWIRQPGQPWKSAKLVMLNEQKVLAPDRQQGHIGSDNDYEYRLTGYFSGEKVYEPASDTIYPEFVLTGYEVRATNPPMIFAEKRSIDPAIRLLTPPM